VKQHEDGAQEQRAVLLDIDGTLLLSNGAQAEAWHDAFRDFGRDVAVERLTRLIGMGGDKLIPAVSPELHADREPGSAIADRQQHIFLERYLPRLDPAPGGRDLLLRLRSDGYRLIVATSAKADEVEALLRAASIDDLVDGSATSADAKRSKPDPDIVLGALARGGVAARDAIMLGDTPYDLDAAARAGVSAVAVRCGGWTDHELRGAAAIYDDPADVLRNYAASPFAR
jgi:HAD superfamily hydrolase (TIGR01509 family)